MVNLGNIFEKTFKGLVKNNSISVSMLFKAVKLSLVKLSMLKPESEWLPTTKTLVALDFMTLTLMLFWCKFGRSFQIYLGGTDFEFKPNS